jgi:hypothetical protein
MSIKSRNSLKIDFAAGTAATSNKFEDLIDSTLNKNEDSLLNGPIGLTGTNGLIGPSGSTFYNGLVGPDTEEHQLGLWLSLGASAPVGPTAEGIVGNVIVSEDSMYICYETNSWLKIAGSTAF